MFVLPFESLQQLDYLLNYFGCQQTAICNEGMFSHIMTTDSWCQTGYAFQFVSGNNNNYSSCKSSLHYSMNSFCCAYFPKTLISTPVIGDTQKVGQQTMENKNVVAVDLRLWEESVQPEKLLIGSWNQLDWGSSPEKIMDLWNIAKSRHFSNTDSSVSVEDIIAV